MFTCIRSEKRKGGKVQLAIGLSFEELRELVLQQGQLVHLNESFGLKVVTVSEAILGGAVPRECELVLFAAKDDQTCAEKFVEAALPEHARAEFLAGMEEGADQMLGEYDETDGDHRN